MVKKRYKRILAGMKTTKKTIVKDFVSDPIGYSAHVETHIKELGRQINIVKQEINKIPNKSKPKINLITNPIKDVKPTLKASVKSIGITAPGKNVFKAAPGYYRPPEVAPKAPVSSKVSGKKRAQATYDPGKLVHRVGGKTKDLIPKGTTASLKVKAQVFKGVPEPSKETKQASLGTKSLSGTYKTKLPKTTVAKRHTKALKKFTQEVNVKELKGLPQSLQRLGKTVNKDINAAKKLQKAAGYGTVESFLKPGVAGNIKRLKERTIQERKTANLMGHITRKNKPRAEKRAEKRGGAVKVKSYERGGKKVKSHSRSRPN